jgi:copper oxidase (laccase) domain-containing protein
LSALGVRSIHGEPRCTYAQSDAFYSFRRDGLTGRMAALIWLDGGPC